MLENRVEFNAFIGKLYGDLIRTEKFELDQVKIIKEKILEFKNFSATHINQVVFLEVLFHFSRIAPEFSLDIILSAINLLNFNALQHIVLLFFWEKDKGKREPFRFFYGFAHEAKAQIMECALERMTHQEVVRDVNRGQGTSIPFFLKDLFREGGLFRNNKVLVNLSFNVLVIFNEVGRTTTDEVKEFIGNLSLQNSLHIKDILLDLNSHNFLNYYIFYVPALFPENFDLLISALNALINSVKEADRSYFIQVRISEIASLILTELYENNRLKEITYTLLKRFLEECLGKLDKSLPKLGKIPGKEGINKKNVLARNLLVLIAALNIQIYKSVEEIKSDLKKYPFLEKNFINRIGRMYKRNVYHSFLVVLKFQPDLIGYLEECLRNISKRSSHLLNHFLKILVEKDFLPSLAEIECFSGLCREFPTERKLVEPKVGEKRADFTLERRNKSIFFEITVNNLPFALEVGIAYWRGGSRMIDTVSNEIEDHFLFDENFKDPYLIIVNEAIFEESQLDKKAPFHGNVGFKEIRYKNDRGESKVELLPTFIDDSLLNNPKLSECIKNLNGIIYYKRKREGNQFTLIGSYEPNPARDSTGEISNEVLNKLSKFFNFRK